MIAELGMYALCWALVFALLLCIVPTLGLRYHKPQWVESAGTYVMGQGIFVIMAYGALSLCFLRDDFTVLYVMANSSLALPWFYKLCAVWGGHEGSMLLWVAILSLWMMAICMGSRRLDTAIRVRVLVVLGALSVSFIVFLLMTSNPFARQFVWLDSPGRDLNPLLQDPGFLFHPPMLYMGYVGFAVAFAFAIAALWMGRIDVVWAKWLRPWTLAAWCFLTLGITLGSWWAYRELGWGGWWFWDPVENASFMPWLVGTALLHGLILLEKSARFMAWVLLMAILAFSLSLLGTFIVRSGVLTSVHAFAVDPLRGIYILILLAVVIGGSLLLFAWRAQTVTRHASLKLVSREALLLLNNIFLVVMMLTVLLGTLYPLLIDALGLGKLSVGAAYFNTIFVYLTLPLMVLMGFGIVVRWRQDKASVVLGQVLWVLILSIIVPLLLLLVLTKILYWMAYLGLAFACWVLSTTLLVLWRRLSIKPKKPLTGGFCGMVLAHAGVAVMVIGIAISSAYGLEDDLVLQPGQTAHFAGFALHFLKMTPVQGPNYHGTRASFQVNCGRHQALIYPEKRIYDVGKMPLTAAAIDISPWRDVYVALGEPLGNGAWSLRMYYKPCVRWIWAGGIMMFMGGIVALVDRRYYQQVRS